MKKKQNVLDIILEKIISRKLLVFSTATYLFYSSGLSSETWGMIAMVYIGGQSAVDIMKLYRSPGGGDVI